jgi:hypothetical protein
LYRSKEWVTTAAAFKSFAERVLQPLFQSIILGSAKAGSGAISTAALSTITAIIPADLGPSESGAVVSRHKDWVFYNNETVM